MNTPLPWSEAVRRVSELAHSKLPEALHGHLERATALVLNHAVWIEEDGHTCQVRASNGVEWYAVNGACGCEDYLRAPGFMCKHRLAHGVWRRAHELMQTGLPDPLEPSQEPAPAHDIPPQFITIIQGKPFVKFAGLLQMAHERGLVELAEAWTYNDAELSLAHAVAIFEDGKRFEGSGDATPQNVTRMVGQHFRRVALTRAKARALRDALGCALIAVEELGEE